MFSISAPDGENMEMDEAETEVAERRDEDTVAAEGEELLVQVSGSFVLKL